MFKIGVFEEQKDIEVTKIDEASNLCKIVHFKLSSTT